MKKAIYSTIHKIVARRLKSARLESDMDQATAAKLLGTTQSQISKFESGQRRIDIIQLKEFGKIYHKKIDYFLK